MTVLAAAQNFKVVTQKGAMRVRGNKSLSLLFIRDYAKSHQINRKSSLTLHFTNIRFKALSNTPTQAIAVASTNVGIMKR
ncbi:MAG: hypothetical protein ACX93T_03175 [Bacteroidota bacterium]